MRRNICIESLTPSPRHEHYIKLDLSFGDLLTPLPQRLELRHIPEKFPGGSILG